MDSRSDYAHPSDRTRPIRFNRIFTRFIQKTIPLKSSQRARCLFQLTFSGALLTDTTQPLVFTGPDGFIFLGLNAYIVQSGVVQKLTFTDLNYSHAIIQSNTNITTGLSSITTAFGRLYVIDSQVVPAVDLGLPAVLPFKILNVDLGSFH